jgi:hypothetical protein
MRRLAIGGAVALFLIGLSTNGFAKPHKGSGKQTIPVTDCQTITHPGNYILENDLVLPAGGGANGNCLVISSSQVNVDLNGHTITSACLFPENCPPAEPGGIGIDIEADHVSVANGFVGAVGGSGGSFTVGLFGEGNFISATNLGLETDIGILLTDVRHSAFSHIEYGGILVSGPVAVGPVMSVSGGGNNIFESIDSSTTTFEGIIITNSSNNIIEGANVSCSAEGEAGPGIILTQDSSRNLLLNNNIFVLFGNGIELDLGDERNFILNNTVTTATTASGFYAMLDQNTNCGSDIWINNNFSNLFTPGQISASPASCIH